MNPTNPPPLLSPATSASMGVQLLLVMPVFWTQSNASGFKVICTFYHATITEGLAEFAVSGKHETKTARDRRRTSRECIWTRSTMSLVEDLWV